MKLLRHLLPTAVLFSTTCLLTATPPRHTIAQSTESQLRPTVGDTEVAPKFVVYVGGGASISPPDTIGGGGGIPMISFSSNGPLFMAGEVALHDDKARLLKIALFVRNSGHEASSFKIGDVSLIIDSHTLNDFVAVGYDSKLCAMGDEDRKKVKEIVVTIPPGEKRQLSFVFPLFNPDSNQGELVLGNLSPVPFKFIAGR
jgi:hypothetical protein